MALALNQETMSMLISHVLDTAIANVKEFTGNPRNKLMKSPLLRANFLIPL